MGVRDALLLNQTGSNFQALQTNDTARLKGDLSLQKDDGTEVLGIDVSAATLNLTGGITGSGNISSSLSSTGSFGRVVATTFHGDGSALRNDLPRSVGIVTQSAQLAADISGSFNEGFFFSSSISGGLGITGSFGKVEASFLFGDGSGVAQTIPRHGLITSSGQLADDISGSFTSGFEFSGAIKADVSAWASVENLITGRRGPGAQGNSATALAAGGLTTMPASTFSALTEEWDGTSWSEVNDLPAAKNGGMAGPSTNDAYFGGGDASWGNIDKWNGTNWTNVSYPTNAAPAEGATGLHPGSHRGGSMGGCASDYLYLINETVYGVGGTFDEYNTATETATRCPVIPNGVHTGFSGDICTGIVAWAGNNPTEANGCTITTCWNGTTWSDTGARLINTPGRKGFRSHLGAGASSTSAVHIGGETGPPSGPSWVSSCVENMHQLWDGISWAVKGDLPTPLRCAGVTGTEFDTFIVGGLLGVSGAPYNQIQSASREHIADRTSGSFGLLNFISASGDGTELQSSITYVTNPANTLLTGSSQIASQISGSFNKGFEFIGQIKGALGGVFAQSTQMNSAHSGGSGGSMLAGTAIIAGGSYGSGWPPQACACTEVYDGSSWSEVNDLIRDTTDQGSSYVTFAGDSSAGVFFGGNTGLTEEWNGTNWSETTETGEYFSYKAGGGGESSEAAIWVGHTYGGRSAVWNGSNWSEISDMIALGSPNREASSFGTSTSFLIAGGGVTPACFLNTEIWNGSSWSENSDMIVAVNRGAGMGTTNDGVIATGHDGTTPYYSRLPVNTSNVWDGTSFSAGSLVNSKRYQNGLGSGTNTANGLSNDGWFGGGSPGSPVYNSSLTEIYPGFTISGSFGRIDANKFFGDGSNLSNLPLPTGLVTGSAQIASRVSGSFNKGFEFSGEISGSATSTGSFGRIEANFLHGDGSSIKDSLPRSTGIVSGAAQIAADISGSFNKGFGYDGLIQTTPGGVWSAGGALNATTTGAAGLGTKSAALSAGTTNTGAKTEEYNGSSWSEVNDLNTGRGHFQGTGTTEAAVVFGGSGNKTNTEEFNGTNWSEVNDLIMGRSGHMKLGITSEAALAVGGSTSEPGYEDADVESWNGTNWSAGTVLPAAAAWGSSAGTYDSGIVFKWPGSETFCWNGSSWSEVADRTLARHCSAGAGSSNDALITGGQSPSTDPQINACTELYNGTSWSTGPNLISARSQLSSADGGNTGTGTTMVFGGAGTSTEHYNLNVSSASFHNIEVTSLTGDGSQFSASLQSQILTSTTQISNSISGSFTSGIELQGGISASFGLYGDAWSLGGAVIDRSRALSGFGTTDAAIKAGGVNVNDSIASNEEWNGAIWSEIADLPAARKRGATAGSVNAGLYAGGNDGSFGGYSECSEVYIWTGITWVETLGLPQGGDNHTGHGFTQNSALVTHGSFSSYSSNNADEWDGTTWTEKTANITSRGCGQGGGGTNAAHIVGGYCASPYATTTKTECWNGTAWSEVSDTNTAHFNGFYAGITNDAHVGMTWGPPNIIDPSTEIYNGMAWAVSAPVIYSSTNDPAASGRTGVGTSQGGTHKFGGGTFSTPSSEIFNSSVSTGSFERLRGTVGGEIKTNMFNITSSTFKLPLFSDADLNYNSQEPEEGTGSMSGSVVRAGDVNVLNKPGNFFFHSDYNALGFTYVSSSVYSQSVDFVSCGYQSASVYTASTGFITQSHYCYHNVIQYITGSYT